jgi:hypothetical protein
MIWDKSAVHAPIVQIVKTFRLGVGGMHTLFD